MASMLDARMPENFRKGDGAAEGGASRASSSLESQLQQAWLQSQLPKVQRRSVSALLEGVLGGKRGCEVPVGPVSGRAGDAGGLEETYFHKSRGDIASDFLRRFSTPQLETISTKTDVPPPLESRKSASAVGDGFSECTSASSLFSSSDDFLIDTQHSVRRGVFNAVDCECIGSGSVDLAGETELSAHFFDDFLTDEDLDGEQCLFQLSSAYHVMQTETANLRDPNSVVGVDAYDPEDVDPTDRFWTNVEFTPTEESSAYKAMAKEIADLLSPELTILDDGGSEVANSDNVSTSTEFLPSEELMTLTLMERYTSMLSKHLKDVSCSSGNVDYRTWITESDEIQLDDEWKSYLESSNQTSATAPIFDFNLLLRGTGVANLSRESAAAPTTSTSTTELLYKCAFAVSQGNSDTAADYLAELQNHSSPYGTPVHRMAHYFMEALVAKMSGTGEELFTAMINNPPSDATVMKAYRVYVDNNPYLKLSHFFSMKSILDAFEGAPRVHIIHYGLKYGVEWPSLLQNLSLRPGGPPYIRLTGVDVPCPGFDPRKRLEDNGQRIAKLAKMWGIPFEFQGLAGKWESFTARDFNLRDDEVLAVKLCCIHTIHDECVLSGSPRELLLKRVRSLNPKVLSFESPNAACNAPFFMTRFRECVKYYSALYDGMEVSMASDDPHRVIIERECLGREILNIVACEGQARVGRTELYRQWQNRLQRTGFTLRPLNPITYAKSKAMMATFHKDYGVGKDDGWLLMGINNQVVLACSVWEPTPLPSFIT